MTRTWRSAATILMLSFGIGVAAAQSVTLAIPDTSGRKGDTLLVPVYASALVVADSVYSGQFTVSNNPAHVSVVGIESAGTLLASGGNPTFLPTTGKFGFATTTPLTGSGPLIFLKVRLLSALPSSPSTFTLAGAMFNEGTPSVVVDAGSVRSLAIAISPGWPAGVVVGDSVQFAATGDVHAPVMWQVSDTATASIDATGKMYARNVGSITVSATDAIGLTSQTSLFAVSPATLRSLTISIPDTSRTQTLTISVPVRVSDVTGLGITSAQFKVDFYAPSLEYLGISSAGTLTSAWGTPSAYLTGSTLTVALAGADSLAGAGTLVNILFRVKAGATVASSLTMSNVLFNESINATVDQGSVQPLAAPLINVAPANVRLVIGETETFAASGAGTPPYCYTLTNGVVGSIDSVTGVFTASGRGASRVEARDAQWFTGQSDTLRVYDFRAVIPVAGFLKSDSIDVPIIVGNTSGLGITSYQFKLAYDTTVLGFKGAVSGGTLSAGLSIDVRDTSGMIRVAGAGASPLSGSGTLLALRFGAKPATVDADSSSLTLTAFQFNEPGPSTPIALTVSGKLGVIVPNSAPVFTSVLPDTAINESDSLSWMFTASDVDSDPLRYFLLNGPPGATIDSMSGQFVFASTFADSGSYIVRVRVTDGLADDTTASTLTVVNVNRPPGFTAELGATEIHPGIPFFFTYVAVDPDGDPIHYSIIQGPSFAMIDSMTGILTLAALLGNAGNHALDVRATDGSLSATTSTIVTVLVDNAASFRFDGTQDRARVLDASPIHPSAVPSAYQIAGAAITVEAWVYLTGLPSDGSEYQIVARGAQSSFGADPYFSFALRVENTGGTPRFNFWLSNGTPGGNFGATADTVSVETGRWYHIAGTYDGTTARLYLDGALKREEASGGKLIGAGTIGLYIGGTTYGYLNGLIDEVRLWNIQRTGPQIAGSKDAILAGTEAGLAGYWPLDSTYYHFPSGQSVTPDKSSNHNDLAVQFDSKVAAFPAGSTVQFAPTNLRILGGDYVIAGQEYRVKLAGDGWPVSTVTINSVPAGAAASGDSVIWNTGDAEFGLFPVIATMSNSAGSIDDTVYVFVEGWHTSANLTTVDITNRGKVGTFDFIGTGVYYGGKNGLSMGDFSLVDRNGTKYAGGLYTSKNSFRPVEGFTSVPSRFSGFTATASAFTDEWEANRIGVRVLQRSHVKVTSPDDRYTIIEYRVVNTSGATIDDLFAQMTADFDIGAGAANRGGFDSTLGLSFAYEDGGATNPNYYGFQLLSHHASGRSVFVNGTDAQYVRSIANLTTFPALPASASDTRNQISAGPFTLAANETLTVAFAYMAADDLTQLRQVAGRARQLYLSVGSAVAPEIATFRPFPGQSPFAPPRPPATDFVPIAVSATQINVYWRSMNTLNVSISLDTGKTWSPVSQLMTLSSSPTSLQGTRLRSGRILLAWSDADGMKTMIWSPSSMVWTSPAVIGTGSPYDFSEATDNSVRLSYQRSGNVYFVASTDEGATWGTERTISAAAAAESAPVVYRRTDGMLLSFYQDNSAANRTYLYSRASMDDGMTWSAPLRVGNPLDTAETFTPRLVRRSDGKLVAAFTQYNRRVFSPFQTSANYPGGYMTGDIYTTESNDEGLTWGEPTQVSRFSGFDSNPRLAAWDTLVWVSFNSNRFTGAYYYGLPGVTHDPTPPPNVGFVTAGSPGPGQPLNPQIHVFDETGIQSVVVRTTLNGVETGPYTLFDDGVHDDYAAGDGVYGGPTASFSIGDTVHLRYEIIDVDNVNVYWLLTTVIPAVHNVGNVRLSVATNAVLGSSGSGNSFLWPASGGLNYLYTGGLWVGGRVGSETRVMEAHYSTFDWRQTPGTGIIAGPGISDQDIVVTYDDSLALSTPLGVRVTQRSFQWSAPGRDDFVIVRYDVTDRGTSAPIESLLVGLWLDVDVPPNPGQNVVGYDSVRQMVYVSHQSMSGGFFGLRFLGPGEVFTALTYNNSSTEPFSDVARFASMSSGVRVVGSQSTDHRVLGVARPVTLGAGATTSAVFGLVIGNGLAELQVNADSMAAAYAPFGPTSVDERASFTVPQSYALEQNYPNPFNPSTSIRFSLPVESRVGIRIYDQLGREVASLVNNPLGAGTHEVRWDARGMASGLYIYRIEATGTDGQRFVKTRKMVVMK